jgi:protein-S-isoprenylcysteine O-methyltransferase Ste14
LLFAIATYAAFFATFLYLIAFVGPVPVVPATVDRGPASSVPVAMVIDLSLIALFGLQHSVMARQGFKRIWTRVVPIAGERSIFVLAASFTLIILFLFWRPMPTEVWNIVGAEARGLVWALFAIGWFTVLLSTCLLNHFELFGLQQAWLNFRGVEAAPAKMRTPFLYRHVRHPLYLGFFIAFWAAPTMTLGHLTLASGMSAWMLAAISFEERDLVRAFGKQYQDYRDRVGMLIPRFRS